ncbi:MAG: class I SAM-dependent methyltransferase [Thiolinea sp.]
MHFPETSAFMLEWLKAPLITASIIPSSHSLARKMVQGLPTGTQSVIELGPGTGVFTRELLNAGIREEALTLVELNTHFANELRKKYPKARMINGAAESLGHFDLQKADAVVSGLPLLSMGEQQIAGMLQTVFSAMSSQGVFIQFTYGYQCPVKKALLQQHNLTAQLYGFVLNNFPPASVYHIRHHSFRDI